MRIHTSGVIVTLLAPLFTYAQAPMIEWQKCLGGTSTDIAYSIRSTMDGGYVLGGVTDSDDGDVNGFHGNVVGEENYDVWVVKLDVEGGVEWQRCLGGDAPDWAYSIQQTADGGFILAGLTESDDGDVIGFLGGADDAWVVKLTGAGNIEWQRCLGGENSDGAYSIVLTADSGYALAGYANEDFYAVKLDMAGAIQWERSLGGSEFEYARAIQQTLDGGYVLAGYTHSNDGDVSGYHGGASDAWVVKLNADGSPEWQNCLGGSGTDIAYAVQQTADTGYVVVGFSGSNDGDVMGGHGDADAWVVKLDADGDIVWQRCLGGPEGDEAWSVQQLADGGYLVSGYTNSNNGDVSGNHGAGGTSDAWAIRLSAEGGLVWQKCLGGGLMERSHSFLQNLDGSFVLAGFANSSDTLYIAGNAIFMGGDVSGNHQSVGDDGMFPTMEAWVVKLGPDAVGFPEVRNEPFLIAPNPVSDALRYDVGTLLRAGPLQVLTMDGRVIRDLGTIRPNGGTIAVHDLAPGCYILRCGGVAQRFVKD